MNQNNDWKEKFFIVAAGFAVFVGVTMLLSDYDPDLALAIIGIAVFYMLISHVGQVKGLLSQFTTTLHPKAKG